jgi:hypothetical protein
LSILKSTGPVPPNCLKKMGHNKLKKAKRQKEHLRKRMRKSRSTKIY